MLFYCSGWQMQFILERDAILVFIYGLWVTSVMFRSIKIKITESMLPRKIQKLKHYWICVVNYLFILYFIYITVPPEKLLISDESGVHIPHYTIGPYNEGSSVNVTCVSTGGKSLAYNPNQITHINFFLNIFFSLYIPISFWLKYLKCTTFRKRSHVKNEKKKLYIFA